MFFFLTYIKFCKSSDKSVITANYTLHMLKYNGTVMHSAEPRLKSNIDMKEENNKEIKKKQKIKKKLTKRRMGIQVLRYTDVSENRV